MAAKRSHVKGFFGSAPRPAHMVRRPKRVLSATDVNKKWTRESDHSRGPNNMSIEEQETERSRMIDQLADLDAQRTDKPRPVHRR